MTCIDCVPCSISSSSRPSGCRRAKLPEHNPALKYQVMMLLDEFTALGRIPIIAEAISYLPGYNVRVVLVIQTPAQLREVYGSTTPRRC